MKGGNTKYLDGIGIFSYLMLVRTRAANKGRRAFSMGHLLSILFLMTSWLTPVANAEVNFNYYTIQEGLSHNIVYAVEKDTAGLMWFATRNGVDSYDGSSFKHYDLITERSPYAESNSARTFLMDTVGDLWVGSDKGLLKYNPDLDLFSPFTLKEDIPIGGIVSIYMDKDGYLWLGSYSNIYVIDPVKRVLIHMFDNFNYVHDIVKYDDENLICLTNNGCFFINRKDHSKIRIMDHLFQEGTDSIDRVLTAFKDKNNNFWFATLNNGVYVIGLNFDIRRRIKSLDFLYKSKTVVKEIFYINENDIGVLTDGEGLIILDENYEIKKRYTYKDDVSSSLNTNALSDVLIDGSGRIWITTIGSGINLYDPNLLPFYHIHHVAENENSIRNNIGNSILNNSGREIWFGTQDGISIWNDEENRWRHLGVFNESNGNDNKIVLTMEKVSDKEIWIGSYGGGIDIYDLKTGARQHFKDIYQQSFAQNMDYIYDLFKDSKGNVWIASLRGQLMRIDLNSRKQFTYPVTQVYSIFEAKDGLIYVGTRSGFVIINEDDELVRFNTDSGIGLSSNSVHCFYESEDGKILMGTEGGGLNIFDPTKKSIQIFSKQDGLISNIINCILPDDNDRYWLSTSKGISTINLKNNKIVNYGLTDGLPVLSFTRGNGIRLDDGQLIFGGYEGYVKFDPNKIVQQEIPVTLKFLDFKVSNISAPIGGKDSPLKKHIDQTKEITLNYWQNSFTFDYTGINFTNSGQNQYSWKLEGFEDEWTPWTNNLSATYTNIQAGQYVFQLRARNPYGLSDSRSIKLFIQSPWWLSFWAVLIYFIVLLTAAFFILYVIQITYKEKQSIEKIQFFTNIAHDIKTPLTLIHTPLQKLFEENKLDEDSRNTIELAMQNAEKIKGIANQLLDFQKVDLKKMELNLEESNFVRHVKEISKSFNPLFEKKNIKFQLLTETPVLEFYYDKKIIEKIVNNLLSNAIKYTNEGGIVSIKIKVQGKQCILKISDDGIGIPEAQKKEIFKRYFRASNAVNSAEVGCGVGLMLVKQLVELLDGEISFTSKENKGTIFTVKLKIVLNPEFQASKKDSRYISVYEMDNKRDQQDKTIDAKEVDDNLPKLLIVEDNVDLQRFLEDSLAEMYAISIASNGNEALEILKKLDPDLIVSDVMMPGMDGRVLCHTLKQKIETCHIPIILLTALSSADHRVEGYNVGADAYIEKPFDMKVLISRIDNLLLIRKTLKGKFFKFDDSPNDIVYHNSLDQDFITKANEVVDREMENPDFDVEIFSEEMNVSRPVLYRKLKALTGQSPHEFIIYAKLRYSVKLLRSNQMSIKEVAYASGFSNSKYFSTTFKKYFDLTPSEFIKDNKDVLMPEENDGKNSTAV